MRPRRRVGCLWPLWLALLLPWPALGADNNDWYRVEVLVFVQRNAEAARAEAWPSRPALAYDGGARSMFLDGSTRVPGDWPLALLTLEEQLLPASDLSTDDLFSALPVGLGWSQVRPSDIPPGDWSLTDSDLLGGSLFDLSRDPRPRDDRPRDNLHDNLFDNLFDNALFRGDMFGGPPAAPLADPLLDVPWDDRRLAGGPFRAPRDDWGPVGDGLTDIPSARWHLADGRPPRHWSPIGSGLPRFLTRRWHLADDAPPDLPDPYLPAPYLPAPYLPDKPPDLYSPADAPVVVPKRKPRPQIQLEPLTALKVPRAFVKLPDDELEFLRVARRLRRSSATDVLLHTAWLQPARRAERATPIILDSAAADGYPELQGNLTLYSGRHLHIECRLWLNTRGDYLNGGGLDGSGLDGGWTMPAPPLKPQTRTLPVPNPGLQAGPFWLGSARADEEPQAEPPHYTYRHAVLLEEQRRIRSGQLNYIDHPMFGVVLRVTRYRFKPFLPIQPTDPEGPR